MVNCVAFEGSYSKSTDYGDQFITEYVIGTNYGVVHYKVCAQKSGRVRIFTDLDASKMSGWCQDAGRNRETLKKHYQFGRTLRGITKAGGKFMQSPWPTTEDVVMQRGFERLFAHDQIAMNAWKTVCGNSDEFPRYEDILDKAEEIVATQKVVHHREKALEMMLVDDQWGIF